MHGPVVRDRVVDQSGDDGRVADVADERGAADPRRDLLGPLGVHVGDDDPSAVSGQALAQRASDPVTAAGHHRASIGEIHGRAAYGPWPCAVL